MLPVMLLISLCLVLARLPAPFLHLFPVADCVPFSELVFESRPWVNCFKLTCSASASCFLCKRNTRFFTLKYLNLSFFNSTNIISRLDSPLRSRPRFFPPKPTWRQPFLWKRCWKIARTYYFISLKMLSFMISGIYQISECCIHL